MDRDQRLFFVGLVLGAIGVLCFILLSTALGQVTGFYGLPPAATPMVHH